MVELIRILYFEVGRDPEIKVIEKTLESMQELVQGHIEAAPHETVRGHYYILNKDGKDDGLPFNRSIYGGIDYIAGNFFICGTDGEEVASIDDDFLEELQHPAKGEWTI